jgi:hypothetical protein
MVSPDLRRRTGCGILAAGGDGAARLRRGVTTVLKRVLLACCLPSLLVLGACPAKEALRPPGGPLEGLIQHMVTGEWDAYGEIAAQSANPQTPYCKLEGYPANLSSGYCWPQTLNPTLRSFPPDGVCGIYMLSTGTPARAVLGIDWLARDLGVGRDELVAEIDKLAEGAPPPAENSPRLPRLMFGDDELFIGNSSYGLSSAPQQAFSYNGARIEYWEATSSGSLTPLDLLYVELDVATAQQLLRQDV